MSPGRFMASPSDVADRVRGAQRPVVYTCDGCLTRSACWPGMGIPRRWSRVGTLLLCLRCFNGRRRSR